MNYIVFDLEFNQDFDSLSENAPNLTRYPFEIIQIGAVKLNQKLKTLATFDRFIKPSLYLKINPDIAKLTGITTQQLQNEETFPMVYQSFLDFIKDADAIFCTWGMSDIKEIYQNAALYQLDTSLLPKRYINLQPLASMYLNLSTKRLLRLQVTVEALNIPITVMFHNAFHDAYYTGLIWKKIYHPSIHPQIYLPNQESLKPRQQKKLLNLPKLIHQFEKMYHKTMSEEEQAMIQLAYHMGKTGQFQEVVTVEERKESITYTQNNR